MRASPVSKSALHVNKKSQAWLVCAAIRSVGSLFNIYETLNSGVLIIDARGTNCRTRSDQARILVFELDAVF